MLLGDRMAQGISLSLAGGGARGFVHVGVLKVFLEEKLPVVEIAGSSMGAIVAAYYAVHGTVEPLEEFARSLDRRTMFHYMDPCLPRHSLMKGDRLRRVLTKWFGDGRIEECAIPLSIIATELRTGKPVVFREGRIVEALMASAAIPGLLPAVRIGTEYYVDGGVAEPLPLSALQKQNTLRVGVALPAMRDVPPPITAQPRLTEVLGLVYATARHRLFEEWRDAVILYPNGGTMGDTLSFQRSAEFVRNGETTAREALANIKLLLQEE
jgi:NTE family protein